jgi:hypothetical protein
MCDERGLPVFERCERSSSDPKGLKRCQTARW